MKPLILLAFISALVFAQTPPAKSAPARKSTVTKSAAAKKAPSAQSSARLLNPALWRQRAPAEFKVKFTTTKGDFVIDARRDWAPLGVDRFYNLVRSGYFTDVSFYRVVPGFVVQFGAAPSPRVQAAWEKAPIKDDKVAQSNTRGRVTFAMGGPGTRTTEIFINLKDNSALDKYPGAAFAPIGEVVEGMEVVDQIYSGYGDMQEQGGHGPSQQRTQREGKAYLDKNFPNLDSIKSATIISGEPAAPEPKAAPKTAAPAVKKAAPVQKKSSTN
jgi:peptidyl-prolyl cis-trans isomerase A (cyclophilin A)